MRAFKFCFDELESKYDAVQCSLCAYVFQEFL